MNTGFAFAHRDFFRSFFLRKYPMSVEEIFLSTFQLGIL